MMMVFQRTFLNKLALTLMFIHFAFASDCPDLAVLKEPMNITASYSDLAGFAWTRPSDGQYIATCADLSSNSKPCAGTTVYTAVANPTFSQLTISSVNLTDVGQWRLTPAEGTIDVCTLSAAGIPSCDIASDDDTSNLDLGVELSLEIDVTDYYCTRQYGVNISLGNVSEHLFSNTSATDYMNNTSILTFNVTEAHFGDVQLTFACEDYNTALTCDGVTRLSRQITSVSTPSTTSPQTTKTTTRETATTTTAATGEAVEPSDDPDLGLILGITIPVVILLVLVLILLYRYRHKYKKYILANWRKESKENFKQYCMEMPKNN